MSTADNFNWASPDAEQLYRQLEVDRQAIADRYAKPRTATEIARFHSGEAEREFRAAVEPINQQMVHLATKYTIPKPIIVDMTSAQKT